MHDIVDPAIWLLRISTFEYWCWNYILCNPDPKQHFQWAWTVFEAFYKKTNNRNTQPYLQHSLKFCSWSQNHPADSPTSSSSVPCPVEDEWEVTPQKEQKIRFSFSIYRFQIVITCNFSHLITGGQLKGITFSTIVNKCSSSLIKCVFDHLWKWLKVDKLKIV